MSHLFKELGPRPHLVLTVFDGRILQVWADRRAPVITIHDYDPLHLGHTSSRDLDGLAFTKIRWKRPAWALGLCLSTPLI